MLLGNPMGVARRTHGLGKSRRPIGGLGHFHVAKGAEIPSAIIAEGAGSDAVVEIAGGVFITERCGRWGGLRAQKGRKYIVSLAGRTIRAIPLNTIRRRTFQGQGRIAGHTVRNNRAHGVTARSATTRV